MLQTRRRPSFQPGEMLNRELHMPCMDVGPTELRANTPSLSEAAKFVGTSRAAWETNTSSFVNVFFFRKECWTFYWAMSLTKRQIDLKPIRF